MAAPQPFSPELSAWSDFFLKFGGALALLYAFLRWLLMPMIRAGLRDLFKDDLAKISKIVNRTTAIEARMALISMDLANVEYDQNALKHYAAENRAHINEVGGVLDNAIGIERRKKGDPSDLVALPEIDLPPIRKPMRLNPELYLPHDEPEPE